MVRRRRPKKGHGAGLERWLITYADMITLLLIFFIVMYTLSKLDAAKFETLAESLAAVFGAGGMVLDSPGPEIIPGAPPEQMADIIREMDEQGTETQLENLQLIDIKSQLEEYIKQNGLEARVSVTSEERGVVLSFQNEVLFDLGSSQLTGQAREILSKVAPILAATPNYIRVEGHTDDLPINTAQFPSNWELSAARATNVVQEFIRVHGFEPRKLSASAYGEYRPRMPNSNPENRQLNRRVDLVILSSEFAGAEPGMVNTLPEEQHSTE
ncbi:OmpA/MotB family protein [Desulfallas thermosapovorans]|uniref:Chemotaxis protein MotB n=1 Tax=Desulfallas thermosapovorans DSM 6562 TaxID=1121431 RepID=A0A5S4ZRK4_9FIRM|nr:flagellar motor protein MotB [Desulfallas thermosapovorans]TYO95537.1 chemotaxis protein MotB [Desulfallas thermosapovorans DSM 6562]